MWCTSGELIMIGWLTISIQVKGLFHVCWKLASASEFPWRSWDTTRLLWLCLASKFLAHYHWLFRLGYAFPSALLATRLLGGAQLRSGFWYTYPCPSLPSWDICVQLRTSGWECLLRLFWVQLTFPFAISSDFEKRVTLVSIGTCGRSFTFLETSRTTGVCIEFGWSTI